MSNVKREFIRVALPTSADSAFEIEIVGFGTPVAAAFEYTLADTDDTLESSIRHSTGFTDGTNQVCCAYNANDGGTTGSARRSTRTDSVFCGLSGTSVQELGSFVSFSTDKVTLNISNPPSSGRFLLVTLIGGSDVTATAAAYKMGTTATQTITGLPAQPDVIYTASNGDDGLNDTTITAHAIFNRGISHRNGGTIINAGQFLFDQNSATDMANGTYISNVGTSGQFWLDSMSWQGEVASYTSDGFTYDPTASAANDYFIYLALTIANSPLLDLSVIQLPASDGLATIGSTSSTPDSVYMLTSGFATVNTANAAIATGSFMYDGTNSYGTSQSATDNTPEADTSCISASGKLIQLDDDGTELYSADTFSLPATGFRADWTGVSSEYVILELWGSGSVANPTGTFASTATSSSSMTGNEVYVGTFASSTASSSSMAGIEVELGTFNSITASSSAMVGIEIYSGTFAGGATSSSSVVSNEVEFAAFSSSAVSSSSITGNEAYQGIFNSSNVSSSLLIGIEIYIGTFNSTTTSSSSFIGSTGVPQGTFSSSNTSSSNAAGIVVFSGSFDATTPSSSIFTGTTPVPQGTFTSSGVSSSEMLGDVVYEAQFSSTAVGSSEFVGTTDLTTFFASSNISSSIFSGNVKLQGLFNSSNTSESNFTIAQDIINDAIATTNLIVPLDKIKIYSYLTKTSIFSNISNKRIYSNVDQKIRLQSEISSKTYR